MRLREHVSIAAVMQAAKFPGFTGVHLPEKPPGGVNGSMPSCDSLSARGTLFETRPCAPGTGENARILSSSIQVMIPGQ